MAPTRVVKGVNRGRPQKFDMVDWMALRDALSGKSSMFCIWLSKQTIGINATRHNMARINGHDDDRCPDCLLGPERNTHLVRCSDPGRTALFDEDVTKLYHWMTHDGKTDGEVAYWIYKYLLLRGELPMCGLGDMSPRMLVIARSFDALGWDEIMHGRLPLTLRSHQQHFCALMNHRHSGDDWIKQFTRRLLDITHGQWLYRNISLHNRSSGLLLKQKQADITQAVAHLADSDPADIPEESKFLLEIDPVSLSQSPVEQKQYWVAAMAAALTAGQRRHRQPTRWTRRVPGTSARTSRAHRVNLYRIQRRHRRLLKELRDELDLQPGSGRVKRKRPQATAATNGSNKRLRKPD